MSALAPEQVTLNELLRDPDDAHRRRVMEWTVSRGFSEVVKAAFAAAAPAPTTPDGWIVPEGDKRCGVRHRECGAVCLARKGHEGSHRNMQGTWIDGPWCEYPAAAPAEEQERR